MSVFKDLIAAITAVSLSDVDETKLVPLSVAKLIVSSVPEDPSLIGSVVVNTKEGDNVSPSLDFNTAGSLMGIYNEGSHQPIINQSTTGPALSQSTISFGNVAAKVEVLGTSLSLPAEVTAGGISLARKYITTIGNGTDLSYAVTHGLNISNVLVQALIYNASTPCTFVIEDSNTVLITFATVPATNSINLIIIG